MRMDIRVHIWSGLFRFSYLFWQHCWPCSLLLSLLAALLALQRVFRFPCVLRAMIGMRRLCSTPLYE